jgi:hypothetical protein
VPELPAGLRVERGELPVAASVNTSPPAVESVPAMLGTHGHATCHRALPVIGSIADR